MIFLVVQLSWQKQKRIHLHFEFMLQEVKADLIFLFRRRKTELLLINAKTISLWPTHFNEFLRTIGIKEKKWPKSSVKKTKVFLWMCAFGAVYKSNTLFQKILFSWAASPVRTWYSFSRSSSRDKTLRKKVREKLPKLICQQDHSFSCLQNFKTKLHYNTSNSMLFE